jgi:hypothetical protein
MTRALTATTRQNYVPPVAVYGRVTPTAKEHEVGAVVQDLCLDNILLVSGADRYTKDETTNRTSIDLTGRLIHLA